MNIPIQTLLNFFWLCDHEFSNICNLQAYYDEMKSSFPCDLHELCRYIASTIGYHHFSAETAIVNYYHMSGDMGPHKDISEIDHDAPLLSFR